MEGVLDFPLPQLKRLELNFFHVEMGLLKWQAVSMPITSRPLQVEGTGESDGLSCKDYMHTLTYYFICCPC
jgi:hypothetical protein